jgi:hypothetical protein
MRGLLAIALAACYSPQPVPGSPCDTAHPCPDPLVCSIAGFCAKPGTVGDGPPPFDSPSDVLLIDTPPGPSNDLPSGATVITDTTMINEDITYAQNDAEAPSGSMFCGGAGGRDVYFTLHNNYTQVWYFDTFGSSYDTVIRVYNTACMTGAPASQICRNNQCGTMQSQMARSFASGDWCIVVDEATPGTGPATLVLNVEKGVHNGTPLASGTNTVTDDTCSGGSFTMASCGGGAGPEINYFTTSCPGVTTMLDASTCAAATTSDTILYVRKVTSELACNDNDAACNLTTTGASTLTGVGLTGAHLFWLVVDSAGTANPACGPFSLTTTLQ